MKTPYSQPATSNQAPPPTGVGLHSSKEYDSNLFGWLGIAVLLHIALVGFFMLVVTILAFLGFDIPLFKAQMKQPDVEFVLVDNQPEQTPRKPTNRRAEKNTRSGGKKVANKPVQVAQQASGAASRRATPKAAVQPQPKASQAQRSQQATRPQRRSQKVAQQRPAPTPSPKPTQSQEQTQAPTPQPPAPKAPVPRKIASASPSTPPNPIAPTIRMPSAPKNPSAMPGGGPVARTSGGTSGGGPSGGSASGSPGSSFIGGAPGRTGGAGNPGSQGRPGGAGGGGGRGSYNQGGSPGGGGGADGVDAMAEPDFGPYIAELQRRIRRNWAPPVEDRSKRVVALFKVARDGRLLLVRIQQSSGSPQADQAAIGAIKASAPFRNLPANYRGSDIDVQFIFDYEIQGGGRAVQR